MRSQFQTGSRLSLVLGAGVSIDFGLPLWQKLVQRVANTAAVDGTSILNAAKKRGLPLTVTTQMLFERLRDRLASTYSLPKTSIILDRKAHFHFREIVRKCLYRYNAGNRLSHPYLQDLLPIIRRSQLTINYNFDDCIERLLFKTRPPDDVDSRGCEVIVNANTHFRRSNAIIYHPNGILPRNTVEIANEGLVFSEVTFADQIFDSVSGYYSTFHNHLTKNTCLLIGLSLDDGGLRHILRQHARNNPGNIHYIIHHVRDGDTISPEYERSVASSNFEVYNLYTLFLTSKQIAALGKLIARNDNLNVVTECEKLCPCRYIYYLAGVPGAGKSTSVGALKCFHTIDEWLEERPPEMLLRHTALSPAARRRIDNWVRDQFFKKNRILAERKEGISVVDRTPLDPLSFSDKSAVRGKAKAFRKTFRGERILDGQVLLFKGDFSEFASRAESLGKQSDPVYLSALDDLMRDVFGPNVVELNVEGMPKSHVIKAILRSIMFDEYIRTPLDERLAAAVKS